MYGIILVSHSKKITDGIKDIIEEMVDNTDNKIGISSCGGTSDGRLGTDSIFILNNIENYHEAEKIFIFADFGSAILSSEMAIDLIEDDTLKDKVMLIDAPLVEGAFAAAVTASLGSTEEEILKEIEYA